MLTVNSTMRNCNKILILSVFCPILQSAQKYANFEHSKLT